jgi:hypothetical protein
MKKFLTTLATFSLFGATVVTVLLVTYIYYDPFKVIRKYKDYSYPYVTTNRDYISTEMFLDNYKKYRYDSFIFGSSRTIAFKTKSWIRYLPTGAEPFMFDASAETAYGIDIKLRLLDSMKVKLKNAILVFCRDATFKTTENSTELLYTKHPVLSGQSEFAFQSTFFKAYISSPFIEYFYDYKFTGKYKTYMTGYIENRKISYDTITNELNILDQEKEITETPHEYYAKRKKIFYPRFGEQIDSVERIKKPNLLLLMDIKRILEKNNTNYKVILSPLYEQIKFNPKDLELLESLFTGHIYDFSGKNKFTDNVTNYYESAHFRPIVGDSILSNIYEDKSASSKKAALLKSPISIKKL